MTTRSPTAKGIEVPDLVGDKADQAIQTLRELGLMPVTWSAAVADVKEAGFVLGLEPPAGTTVRAKTLITLSVATHPDFQGHDVDLDLPPDRPMQPPLAWPLSAPTGFAQPHPDAAPPTVTVAFPSAAAPAALSAPASPTPRPRIRRDPPAGRGRERRGADPGDGGRRLPRGRLRAGPDPRRARRRRRVGSTARGRSRPPRRPAPLRPTRRRRRRPPNPRRSRPSPTISSVKPHPRTRRGVTRGGAARDATRG